MIGTIVAEMLLQRPAAGERQWMEIGEGARLLGLSIRDLAGFLGVEYEIPEAPSTPGSTGRHRRMPLWLPGRR
ncbi:hypothetical protein [Nocardia nova]|uniref:hypothetical protein n=1 Tax=Nocardia nova TaxID=37330 RepID=UPI0007A3CBE2|nr:hypothetical protein [Nocardia nova]